MNRGLRTSQTPGPPAKREAGSSGRSLAGQRRQDGADVDGGGQRGPQNPREVTALLPAAPGSTLFVVPELTLNLGTGEAFGKGL